MQSFSLGAGLAALAFWGFIASVVVAGIWYDIRKRESQQETLRRLIESGHPIDRELMDELVNAGAGGSKRSDRDFKVTALWLLPVSVGLLAFGLIMGHFYPQTLGPLLGASALVGCLGIGYLVASNIARRSFAPEDN